MRFISHYFVVFTTFVLLAQSARGGDVEQVHPAKALYQEFEALRTLAGHGRPAIYNAKYASAIKAGRDKIIAYTHTHEGKDLDGLNWANAFESIYSTSASSEWKTCGESEQNVREAWKVLSTVKIENPEKLANLSLMVARWHIANWCVLDPEACAALLDETEFKFMEHLSPGGLSAWKWVVPDFEACFILGAKSLPPERRASFSLQRETGLFRHLQDESISVNTRSEQLATYANLLYGQGEAERAANLLEAWWNRHGELIQSSQFYSARFHIACYGIGDWSTAREALRHMDRMVVAGEIAADDGLYKLAANNFYKNIIHPEYDMKRRAVIHNAETKMKSSKTIWR